MNDDKNEGDGKCQNFQVFSDACQKPEVLMGLTNQWLHDVLECEVTQVHDTFGWIRNKQIMTLHF